MKELDVLSAGLSEALERGRGGIFVVRCPGARELAQARRRLLDLETVTVRALSAEDFPDGGALLDRAQTDRVVFLVDDLPRSQPPFYRAMEGRAASVNGLRGPLVVFLVGFQAMQSMVQHCQSLWDIKRGFIAWPAADPSPRPDTPPRNRALSTDDMLEALSRQAEQLPTGAERGKAFAQLAKTLLDAGKPERARKAATSALRNYEAMGAANQVGQTQELLSGLAERRGDVHQAREWMRQALATWQLTSDRERIAECHAKVGHLAFLLGARAEAAEHFQTAIRLDKLLGRVERQSAGLRRLGLLAEEEGQLELAERFFQDALALIQDSGDRLGVSRCYHHLGRLRERAGDYAVAFDRHKQSLKLKEECGDRQGMATSFHHLGNTYFFTRDLGHARQCYEKALEIEASLGDHHGRAATLLQLGVIFEQEGDARRALLHVAAAERIFRRLGATDRGRAATDKATELRARVGEAVYREVLREADTLSGL